jgi:hypothetical protein
VGGQGALLKDPVHLVFGKSGHEHLAQHTKIGWAYPADLGGEPDWVTGAFPLVKVDDLIILENTQETGLAGPYLELLQKGGCDLPEGERRVDYTPSSKSLIPREYCMDAWSNFMKPYLISVEQSLMVVALGSRTLPSTA